MFVKCFDEIMNDRFDALTAGYLASHMLARKHVFMLWQDVHTGATAWLIPVTPRYKYMYTLNSYRQARANSD